MASTTQRFRELIKADEVLTQPGIYDWRSARPVQISFTFAAVPRTDLGETNFGRADVGLVGFKEHLHASRAIAACVDLPVSADGIMLEDQLWTAEAAVEKIRPPTVVLQSAAEGRVIERPDPTASFKELNVLVGFSTIKEMERRLRATAQGDAKYGAAR